MALFQLDHTVVYTIQFSCKRRFSNRRDDFYLFTPTALSYGNNTDLAACALHSCHAFLIPISHHLFATVTAISLNRNPFRKCLFHIYFTLLANNKHLFAVYIINEKSLIVNIYSHFLPIFSCNFTVIHT